LIFDSIELATWFVSFWFAIWVGLISHSICFFDGLVPALNIGVYLYLFKIVVVSLRIEISKSVVSSCQHQEFLCLLLE
jgi:hypothetical protein